MILQYPRGRIRLEKRGTLFKGMPEETGKGADSHEIAGSQPADPVHATPWSCKRAPSIKPLGVRLPECQIGHIYIPWFLPTTCE